MGKIVTSALSILLSGAVVFCVGAVSAQPGQGPGGGPGKAMHLQPEERLMRMSRMLDLTEEQKAKIKPILEEESSKIKAVRDDTSLTRDQRRTKVREIHTATYELIKPILTPEQQKKHEEIRKTAGAWHKKGLHALSPADRLERMGRMLNLTDDQKTKIKPIMEEETAKMKQVFDDASLTRQQKRDKAREIHGATYEKIKPLLTPEQQKKHDEMWTKRKGAPKQGSETGQP